MCGEKGVVDLCHVEVNGITPAYAGKRKPPPDRHKNWGDHPRMCGEKLLISAYFRFKRGSPPAYAGKSWRASKKPPGSSDHPRVCEEKNFLLLMTSRRSGSPPRVRGKAPMGPNNPLDVRITPAYAGKRYRYSARTIPRRDHPRVCGEKIASWTVCKVSMGSPPHMRGKAQAEQPLPHVAGITPACAGKSRTRSEWQSLIKDHPRACGEKCPPGKFFFMTVGSPPRMRGKVPSSI